MEIQASNLSLVQKIQKQNKQLKNQLYQSRNELVNFVQKIYNQLVVHIKQKDEQITTLSANILILQNKLKEYFGQIQNLNKLLKIEENKLIRQVSLTQKCHKQLKSLHEQQKIHKQKDQQLLTELSCYQQSQTFNSKEIQELKSQVISLQTQLSKQRKHDHENSTKRSTVSSLKQSKTLPRSISLNENLQQGHIQHLKAINQRNINEYLTLIYKTKQDSQRWYRRHTSEQIDFRKSEQKVSFTKDGFQLDHSNSSVNFDMFLKPQWKNLQFIRFDHCKIGDKGFQQLLKHSQHFPNLKMLCLHQNAIHQIKQNDLQNLKSLQFADFTDNFLNKQSIQNLRKFHKKYHHCSICFTLNGNYEELKSIN